jgi:hypothetical protein
MDKREPEAERWEREAEEAHAAFGRGRVRCDSCRRASATSEKSPRQLREELRTQGWRCAPGRDLCPDCAKAQS